MTRVFRKTICQAKVGALAMEKTGGFELRVAVWGKDAMRDVAGLV